MIKATISRVQYETGEDGDVRALLKFDFNQQLKDLSFSYLSIPIDQSVTTDRSLALAAGDITALHFNGDKLAAYEIIKEYITKPNSKTTEIPKTCNVCGETLKVVNTIEKGRRAIKKVSCTNYTGCNAHARASIYRLLRKAGVENVNIATYFLNDHYAGRITHLFDVAMVMSSIEGDPNTDTRLKMWNGKAALWEVEKKLYSYRDELKKNGITDRDFWYIGFGLYTDIPRKFSLNDELPKVVFNNLHLVKQLENFFEVFVK